MSNQLTSRLTRYLNSQRKIISGDVLGTVLQQLMSLVLGSVTGLFSIMKNVGSRMSDRDLRLALLMSMSACTDA